MTIGQRIDEIRNMRHLSLQQLSIKSHVPSCTICSWIYRDIQPTIGGLIKIADALNVSLDDLVGREFPREEPTYD